MGKLVFIFSRYKKSLISISWLWLGSIAGAGLTFATQTILARVLGIEQFGKFSSAFAMVTLLAPLAGFGVAGFWLNIFGREGWRAQRWLRGSLKFLIFSTVFVLLLLWTWAWIGPHDTNTTWLLVILSIHVFGVASIELTGAKYQLEGRHASLAGLQLTPNLLRFICIIFLLTFIQKKGEVDLQVMYVAAIFAVVAIVILLFGSYQISLMVKGQLVLEGHSTLSEDIALNSTEKPGPWEVMSVSWPFGIAGLFYLIYFQSDIILVKYLVNESAVGAYSVAFAVMNAVYLFPSVLYQKFFLPKLHRWAHYDQNQLNRVYRVGNIAMLGLGLVAMILLWLIAPVLLPNVFGAEYQAAVMLLIILSVATPFRFVANSVGAFLATRNHMRMKVRLMGVGALINIVLNFSLIPIFGVAGAAAATVATEALIMVMYLWYYKTVFRFSIP